MDAGRKLDSLIAQHVFPELFEGIEIPQFSTDLNAAWKVVEEICGRTIQLQLSGNRIWRARFHISEAHTLETRDHAGLGSTPAQAICLAALAVKGVKP